MTRKLAAGIVLACLGSVALGAGTASADEGSLFSGPGQRPGPSLLYKRPKLAPQLTNAPAGPWRAPSILVSGASAYRQGEFLYQDFLYDDVGAKAKADPNDPRPGASVFSGTTGTYTYPTAAGYANNAADLVELRVKPLASATAFRLTFNTLTDPALTAATIAIGSSSSRRQFPHGANASAPAQLFLTWHGDTADLIDAASGDKVAGPLGVDVDLKRRQVTLEVPHSSWDPGRDTVRLAAGAGLWDRANDRYLLPQASADADTPGGAGGLAKPTAFFNVAFRYNEPFQFGAPAGGPPGAGWWRERLQANALAAGNLSSFRAFVSFDRLVRGLDTELRGRSQGAPTSGPVNRILSSRFVVGSGGLNFRNSGEQLRGRLQPYSLYIPKAKPAGGRYQLTLLLHSLTGNYNQMSGSNNQRQFGDRSRPSLVITPEGRGPDGFYKDIAGADTYEVWADVAARYPLEPRRTTIAGYSMGGFGSYRLASQFPDLFARAQPTVGAPDFPLPKLASVRWVPFRMWNATKDELVGPGLYRPAADELQRLGYRYELDEFTGLSHIALAGNDQYGPAARFLDAAQVVRNPPRVTFVRETAMDFPSRGTTADHAYWISRIRLLKGATNGSIDVRSRGFGRGDPDPLESTGSGRLVGGATPLAFTYRKTRWGPIQNLAVRDRLDVTATNVRSITVDAERARVSCGADVRISSKDPVVVTLRNCPGRGR